MKPRSVIRGGLLVVSGVLMMALAAHAANPTFADLLAQAKTQAAAGHQWEPPGDNTTETVMKMMDLVPTAKPAEISELMALLESFKPGTPSGVVADVHPPVVEKPAQPASSAAVSPDIAPGASPKREVVATAEPPVPPVLPNRSSPSSSRQATPRSTAPVAIVPDQSGPGPASRGAVLFARGLEAELQGDFSGARRYYAISAEQGDAAAARNLGRLYDPAYLKQTTIGGIDADPALARKWYERAVKLGDAEAGSLLEAQSVR